jgi:hypothetical protein
MALVVAHGEHWPRNKTSFKALKDEAKNPNGVYVLRDGSMPLYIGTGKISSRISKHCGSRSKGKYWDYFSWYAIPNEKHRKQIESLLLRLLPFYLRSLNKQRGKLIGSKKINANKNPPEYVKKPQLAPKRRTSKKRRRS